MPEARVDGHSTDGRIGAGIDRKHEAGASQRSVQLLARHACFDRRVEILGAHPNHAVHLAKIDRDAAPERVHVALEGRARTERDHRELKPLTDLEDCGHLLGADREADQVGRRRRMVRLAVTVVLAHRHSIAHAGSQECPQLHGGRFDCTDLFGGRHGGIVSGIEIRSGSGIGIGDWALRLRLGI